jgi:prophage regulatory protein
MADGAFPKPVKLGTRKVAWRESDIAAWIEDRSEKAAVN